MKIRHFVILTMRSSYQVDKLTFQAFRTGGLLTSIFHLVALAFVHYLQIVRPFDHARILSLRYGTLLFEHAKLNSGSLISGYKCLFLFSLKYVIVSRGQTYQCILITINRRCFLKVFALMISRRLGLIHHLFWRFFWFIIFSKDSSSCKTQRDMLYSTLDCYNYLNKCFSDNVNW